MNCPLSGEIAKLQSQSVQQFWHLSPQQSWPTGHSVPAKTQRLLTQLAPEQPVLGHSDESTHWMQPSGGWHLKPGPSVAQF